MCETVRPLGIRTLLYARSQGNWLSRRSVWGLALLSSSSHHHPGLSSSTGKNHWVVWKSCLSPFSQYHRWTAAVNVHRPGFHSASDLTFQGPKPQRGAWPSNLPLIPFPETQGVNMHRAGKRLEWTPQDFQDFTRKKVGDLLSHWSHSCFLLGVGLSHYSRQVPWGSFAYRCQQILKIR